MPSAWTPDHQNCPNPPSQSRKPPSRLDNYGYLQPFNNPSRYHHCYSSLFDLKLPWSWYDTVASTISTHYRAISGVLFNILQPFPENHISTTFSAKAKPMLITNSSIKLTSEIKYLPLIETIKTNLLIFDILAKEFFIQWHRNPPMNWWDQRWCTWQTDAGSSRKKCEQKRGIMWAHGWYLLKEYEGVIGVSRKLIKPHIYFWKTNFQKQQTAAAP